MDIRVFPRPLGGHLDVISSKSLSHRYVIAAGLSKGKSVIENVLDSDDLDATKKALESLNVTIDGNDIIGRDLAVVNPIIDANASGSTVRFFIPIALMLDEAVIFEGQNRLPDRPLDVYETLFKDKGVTYERLTEKHLPIKVKGPLKGGHFRLSGNVSSQFITGLLFACPLLKEDSTIEITDQFESQGYVDLTCDVLKQFGIEIKKEGQQFFIKGNQSYQPQKITVEGDYSQAAFFMVAGLLGQTLTLKKLNPNSLQGDQKIVDIIAQMQGDIQYIENKYVINPSYTKGMTIDLSQIPDLGPILMVLAALTEGQTTFTNAKRLRIKESDRLEVMYQILKKFEVPVTLHDDTLTVTGIKTLKGNQTFETHEDHRIAMALMIASSRVSAPIVIKDIEVINKSYKTFLKDFLSLGGYYETIK